MTHVSRTKVKVLTPFLEIDPYLFQNVFYELGPSPKADKAFQSESRQPL